jgi:conjugal transfer ATP-binding protein TraC
MILLRRQPARQLAELGRPAAVLATGAIGYVDAAEDDRRRWIAGFRALLDGLEAPLQVLVDFVPGAGDPEPPDVQAAGELPAPPLRRGLDLAFAQSLRESRSAQRRDVHLATTPSAVDGLERTLRDLGVPDVRRVDWQPPAGVLFGTETPTAVEDCQGCHRTWWLERFPGVDLVPGWLLRLVPGGLRLSLGWHSERLPTAWVVDYLQRQLVHMRATQMHLAGGVGDPEIEGAAPAAEALQRRLSASQESAFHVSMYLTVSTASATELEAAAELVEAAARSALCHLLPATFRQLDGRLATLPLARDPLGRRRVLDTSSLATMFPWFDADLQETTGLVIGASRATGQPVLIDPFDDRRYANANVGIFGHSGAGKTYLLSTLTLSALSLGAQVFVIDPEHEYGGLARLAGGVDVQLALGSSHSINVLDLRGEARDESTVGPAVADAVELCAVICGAIDETERAQLEVAVRRTFETVETPVLGDVAARLPETSRVGRVLARWVQGSLGHIFSRPTNVELDAPLIVFGMRELRAEMVAPVHYLLAEALWARIKMRDRRRMLVVDELGLLFEDPTVRRFVVSLARRIRKYNGSLVFATQNPGDLLSGDAGAVVATNPALHFFGAQRPGEAGKLQQAFGLSEAQRAGLETARRGEFLLAAGNQRLPIRIHAPPWQSAAIELARPPANLS